MIYTNYKPSPPLLPYIDRYWYCSSDGKTEISLFPVFPGTGLDLIIHFESSFHTKEKKLPSSHTFCPRQSIDINATGKLDFLAIRFRCGTFRHFCSVHFKELNNEFLSVTDIWGKDGQEFLDKLHEEQSSLDRINILDAFFREQLNIHNKSFAIPDTSISYIYKNYENTVINSLAKDFNISLRHFERLFKEEFDISPKRFQVISRFQSTIKEILLSPHDNYLQIALENGYYDQSHFIKECKLLSGMSPTEILSMKNKNVHFFFKKYSDFSSNKPYIEIW